MGKIYEIAKLCCSLSIVFLAACATAEGPAVRHDHTVAAENLQIAVEKCDLEGVKSAVRSGANPHRLGFMGYSHLISGTSCDDPGIVSYLIDVGVGIDTVSHGETALIAAIRTGRFQVAAYLIQKGANIQIRTPCGETALSLIAAHAPAKAITVKQLLQKQGATQNDILTLLDQRQTKKILQNFDLRVIAQCKYAYNAEGYSSSPRLYYRTLLYEAATQGDSELVAALIEARAPLDLHDEGPHARTPLMRAAHNGHRKVVELLLKAGAKANWIHSFEGTALNMAVQQGHIDIVRILLSHGVEVNAFDSFKHTPLESAVDYGNPEMVQLLLTAGADYGIKGDINHFYLLSRSDRLLADRVKGIRKEGHRHFSERAENENDLADRKKIVFLLNEAVTQRHAKMLAKIKKGELSVDISDADGTTPLLQAVYDHRIETILQLIALGASVDRSNNWGESPLARAIEDNQLKFIKVLIRAGANVNQVPRRPAFSPLITAIRGGQPAIVQELLTAGANPNQEDSWGYKPLKIARHDLEGTSKSAEKEILREIIRLLEKAGAHD